jgi:dihydrolipoamide dehydrogenase
VAEAKAPQSSKQYDLVIVGGGPGGYRAAEHAGKRGMSVLLVEKEHLGGVCLNWGCVPTKTLLHSAKTYLHAREGEQFGVITTGVGYDLAKAMEWKRKTVDMLRKGIASQMKRFKVDVVSGVGRFTAPTEVEVDGTIYRGKKAILATGSSSAKIPIPGIDLPHVVTSTELLDLEKLPKKLVVIGGGVIGMEFASYLSSVGVEVTVVEMLDEIAPVLDSEISQALRKALSGITYHLGARVEEITAKGVRFSKAEKSSEIEADLVLLSVGRRPNVDGLGLDEIGLEYGKAGVRVDERMRTNLPGLYAVGDVNGKSLLAHSAYRMADVAVRDIAGERSLMRYDAIPSVVYTIPEAASCGMTEAAAASSGRKYRVARMQMRANGRFLAEYGRAPGLCKVVVDAETDVILGIHLFGDGCSEMIYGAAVMIESELRAGDVGEIVFPHPTVSEIIQDTIAELDHKDQS